jgi:hypothetical protein
MHLPKPTMDEGTSRFWGALFSAVTTLALIAGGAYSLVQYFQTREKERQTYEFQAKVAQYEAKKPFYSRTLELCSEASSTTGTIATTTDKKKQAEAIDNFWRLYTGPLGIVENQEVSDAMQAYGDCLNKPTCGPTLKLLSLGEDEVDGIGGQGGEDIEAIALENADVVLAVLEDG